MTGVDVEHTKARISSLRTESDVCKVHRITPGPSSMESALTAAEALVAAVERVQALHTPVSLIVNGKPYGTLCRECTDIDIVNAWECDDGDPGDGYIEHLCPTIRALETP